MQDWLVAKQGAKATDHDRASLSAGRSPVFCRQDHNLSIPHPTASSGSDNRIQNLFQSQVVYPEGNLDFRKEG